MNNKQTFFLLTLLTLSGNMMAGKKTKAERKRAQIAAQRAFERQRTESLKSLKSLESFKSDEGRSSVETVLEDDMYGLRDGDFVNPNHTGITPATSKTKLSKRARKLQAKADRQAELAAASFCKGRS